MDLTGPARDGKSLSLYGRLSMPTTEFTIPEIYHYRSNCRLLVVKTLSNFHIRLDTSCPGSKAASANNLQCWWALKGKVEAEVKPLWNAGTRAIGSRVKLESQAEDASKAIPYYQNSRAMQIGRGAYMWELEEGHRA